MAKGLPRSLSRGDALITPVKKHRVAISETVEVDASSGVGFGSAVITDLPEGHVLLLGAMIRFDSITGADGDTGVIADEWDGDFSVGSTPVSDGTIGGADADIIASTALGPASSAVVEDVVASDISPVLLDNSDGSLEVNLNFLIDDDGTGTDGDVTLTAIGRLTLLYTVMDDD